MLFSAEAVSSPAMAPQRSARPTRDLAAVAGLLVAASGPLACQQPHQDLTQAQMAPVIAAGRPALQDCFQAALNAQPTTSVVKLEAAIHIGAGGEVYDLQLGEGALPGMEPCIDAAIRGWRFPAAPDATHAALPLVFTPEPPKPAK